MDSGGSGLAVCCGACASLVPPGISGRYQFRATRLPEPGVLEVGDLAVAALFR